MSRRGRLALALWIAVGLSAAHARAAEPTPEDKALATTLFKEAKDLFASGRTPEACRKFEESHRLDPLPGTLLNLAVCHEKEGRTATAWAEFREALVQAQRDKRDDRISLAQERIAALEPKLSRLTITLGPGADVAGLEVKIDGREVRRAAWGTAMPVDPGDHVVDAQAPGKIAWKAGVNVKSDAGSSAVTIPKLEDAPSQPATAAPAPATTSPLPVHVEAAPTPPVDRQMDRRTIAILVGGAGVVAVGFGTLFGLRAISKHHDSDSACTTNPCSDASKSLNDDAKTAADVSTVAFATGVVALGIGTYLFVTSNTAKPTTGVRVTPAIAPGRASIGLYATF